MVRLEINGQVATIEDGRVAGAPDFASLLRDHLALYLAPGPADPDPDRTQAERLIEDFGGQILHADPPPEYDAAVVY